MATNFPASQDNFTNPTSSSSLSSPSHSQQHSDVNDAVEAIEGALLDGAPLHIDDANERVGIGTASPNQKLHVNSGAGNVAGLFESTDSVAMVQIKDNATTTPPAVAAVGDEMRLQTSGSSRLTVDSSGYVGINDSTPSYQLDVNGDINATGGLRIGGTAVGVWQTWSPTVSVTTGSATITVNNAEFTQVGKLVVGRFDATVTAQGTGSGSVDFTLPVQPAYATDGCGSGRNAWTGDLLQVFIFSTVGNGTAAIRNYNNGGVVITNYALHVNFVYEAA